MVGVMTLTTAYVIRVVTRGRHDKLTGPVTWEGAWKRLPKVLSRFAGIAEVSGDKLFRVVWNEVRVVLWEQQVVVVTIYMLTIVQVLHTCAVVGEWWWR